MRAQHSELMATPFERGESRPAQKAATFVAWHFGGFLANKKGTKGVSAALFLDITTSRLARLSFYHRNEK